jgi:aspartate/methionine/tyrosine aminotransferase
MTTRRFSDLPEYAFPRLRALLDRHKPGGDVIAMSLGEPQHALPPLLAENLAKHAHLYNKYPPIDGTPGWREAVGAWLTRRYGLSGSFDPDAQLLPLNGSREGLFSAALALAPAEKNGKRAAFLLPNPFYQVYAAAALAIGAEPVCVPATQESGWLPDFSALPDEILERTTFAYYCSPSNPQGAVADTDTIARMIGLAETYGFIIAFDEPYSEVYRDAPPPGALSVVEAEGADPERVLVFNTLSKRSNAAGLRSAFVAGGTKNIGMIKRLRAYSGSPNPIPALHAAEALWRDEDHVVESRKLYQDKYALADEILGGLPGYIAPEAGFFLWLDVGDGEAGVVKLWKDAGVKCLPGAYLGRGDPRFNEGENPGARFMRAALVESAEVIKPGLEAIARLLKENTGAET